MPVIRVSEPVQDKIQKLQRERIERLGRNVSVTEILEVVIESYEKQQAEAEQK